MQTLPTDRREGGLPVAPLPRLRCHLFGEPVCRVEPETKTEAYHGRPASRLWPELLLTALLCNGTGRLWALVRRQSTEWAVICPHRTHACPRHTSPSSLSILPLAFPSVSLQMPCLLTLYLTKCSNQLRQWSGSEACGAVGSCLWHPLLPPVAQRQTA